MPDERRKELPSWAVRPVERLASLHRKRLLARLREDTSVDDDVRDHPLTVLTELFLSLPGELLSEPRRARCALVWITERYLDGGIRLLEDALGPESRAGRALAFWAKKKHRVHYGLPDALDGFADLVALESVTTMRDPGKADTGFRSRLVEKALANPEIAAGTKVVHDDDASLVVEVTTYEAEKFWGSGTNWCTVPNEYTCNRYLADGPLYVLIDKSDGEKYQLHFPTGQFCNARDYPASPSLIPTLFPTAPERATPRQLVQLVSMFFRHDAEVPAEWAAKALCIPEAGLDVRFLSAISTKYGTDELGTVVDAIENPAALSGLASFVEPANAGILALLLAKIVSTKRGRIVDHALRTLATVLSSSTIGSSSSSTEIGNACMAVRSIADRTALREALCALVGATTAGLEELTRIVSADIELVRGSLPREKVGALLSTLMTRPAGHDDLYIVRQLLLAGYAAPLRKPMASRFAFVLRPDEWKTVLGNASAQQERAFVRNVSVTLIILALTTHDRSPKPIELLRGLGTNLRTLIAYEAGKTASDFAPIWRDLVSGPVRGDWDVATDLARGFIMAAHVRGPQPVRALWKLCPDLVVDALADPLAEGKKWARLVRRMLPAKIPDLPEPAPGPVAVP